MTRALRVLALAALLALAPSIARADPQTAAALREANAAATAGDWGRVEALTEPLLAGPRAAEDATGAGLAPADRAEAHRLAGLAAFFAQRRAEAEHHLVAWLAVVVDGRLDPALYPPEVVQFLDDVRVRRAGELRARRPAPRRYWWLNLVPPGGQLQNRERTKAYVVGGALGGLAIANLGSYLMLRAWCRGVSGRTGDSATCDDDGDHAGSAQVLRAVNVVAGVGLILTYAYGVYDGASGYRRQRRERMQPAIAPVAGGGVVGIAGSW